MDHFVNHVVKHLHLFYKIEIPYREIHFIQNKVLAELKLKDLNELRDKFEGQQYYTNQLNKCLPIIALEKVVKVKLVDWQSIKLKQIKSSLIIEGTKINIICSSYGQVPQIEIDSKLPSIFVIANGLKEVWICGIGSNKLIQNYIVRERQIGIGSQSKMVGDFIGLNHLKKFNSMDELLLVIKEEL